MNYKKYTALFSLVLLGIALSCTDESLFPLPYNARTVAGYVRMYKVTSNSFDINNIANSAFETIYEPVDEKNGGNLATIEYYASLRRGTGVTGEVLVKTVDNSGFVAPAQPTYSIYTRQLIRITAAETLAALQTAPATPPSTVQAGLWPLGGTFIAPPAAYAAADQIVYRWVMVLKDGRRWSVTNIQGTNPAIEINNSTNLATGVFYNAPSQRTITVRSLLANSWVGTYGLKQVSIWSPNHSVSLHQTAFPAYMNQVLFPNQVVTLSVPAGGLSSEREFTVTYRGSTVTMRINLESTSPGLSAGTVGIMNTAPPNGLGFTGATTANLGTVFVPLRNSTLSCSSKRQLYWVTPGTGTFGGTSALKPGLPQFTTPSRGVFRTDILGTNPGDVFSINVDDDCDEYGRGSGYCTWTRRVCLTLTKQ